MNFTWETDEIASYINIPQGTDGRVNGDDCTIVECIDFGLVVQIGNSLTGIAWTSITDLHIY